MSSARVLEVINLGLQDYQTSWQAMTDFTNQRTPETIDQLWLVEHPPVFTQGQAGKAEHLLFPGDIPVVQSDRGGQVTYHGPGQLVAYPLLDLRRLKIGVRELVTSIEQTIVATLTHYGIESAAKPDAPGVYVNGDKIASLGLRVRRGCSFHGLALNVAMDLAPFQRINPCGYQGLAMTQMKDLLPNPPALEDVQTQLVAEFARKLGYETCTMRAIESGREPGKG
ncbi:lipoyl(octanoyl) transferase [Cellvibrio fibrivorans]|uniref:Octanoyltransferase n=2 Tax=Cellvibrionaceae TaxID=1706371 RepID=A0ABU1USC4_9GAMM|nr:lipoyl(octanoyl) transferase LipB [Cellvibrio fibrivorans]MDR7088081.1 lipoyl(octanoyl) transferase [Cellvibrio fibrivorans]